MSSVILILLAGLGAFFIGRFMERARTAHQLYSSYRARLGTNFRAWLMHSMTAFLIGVGTIVVLFAAMTH